jgi:hypothetical protein
LDTAMRARSSMLPSPSPNRSLLQHRPCTPPCRTLQLNPFPTLTSLLLKRMWGNSRLVRVGNGLSCKVRHGGVQGRCCSRLRFTPPCRTLQLNPFPTLTSLLLPHMRFPRPQVNRTHSNPSQTLGRLLNHQRRHTSRPKRHIPHLNRSDNHQCRTHRLRPWKLPPHHRSTWPRTLRPHPPDRYPISPSNPAHPPVQPATPRHHPSLQRPPPRPHRRKPRHRSTSPTLRLRHNSRSTRHPRSSLRLSTSTAPTRSRKPQLPSSQTRPRPSPRVWRNRNEEALLIEL